MELSTDRTRGREKNVHKKTETGKLKAHGTRKVEYKQENETGQGEQTENELRGVHGEIYTQ